MVLPMTTLIPLTMGPRQTFSWWLRSGRPPDPHRRQRSSSRRQLRHSENQSRLTSGRHDTSRSRSSSSICEMVNASGVFDDAPATRLTRAPRSSSPAETSIIGRGGATGVAILTLTGRFTGCKSRLAVLSRGCQVMAFIARSTCPAQASSCLSRGAAFGCPRKGIRPSRPARRLHRHIPADDQVHE